MAEIASTAAALPPDARADRREVAFRGGGFLPVAKPLYSWLAFAALIGLWQVAIAAGWLNPVFLPSPASILAALGKLIVSGALWQHLSASLGRIGLGWLVGTALGLVFGLAMGLLSTFRAAGMPLVSALYPIPKIALLPLLILWLGIGESPKVVIIAAGVFFPTVISTFSGVDAVPRNLIRMAQSFNMPVAAIIRKIVLPAALPAILAGFRISIASALLLVVAAEMIGAQFGIGAFLLTAGNLMQSDDLMAGVVVLSVLGLGFGAVITAIERAFLSWR
jgi:ABC-type nitrate/sulfonate/bicarbonate transport system permease component